MEIPSFSAEQNIHYNINIHTNPAQRFYVNETIIMKNTLSELRYKLLAKLLKLFNLFIDIFLRKTPGKYFSHPRNVWLEI